jgi:hypothetical protein
MNTSPLAFLRSDLPDLFNRGMAQTKARADGGDAKAKGRYEDAAAARGAIRVVLEGQGGGEVWLSVEGGAMKALDARPADLPVRMVVAAPAEAAKAGLEELDSSGLFEREEAPRRFARTASAEVEKMLAGHTIEMHLTLTDLPADPDEVTLRVGIGVSEPPANPRFTAAVSWDDIEDLRAGDLTPQQLFGRLKLKGDASQAMALGMALMQRRQGR